LGFLDDAHVGAGGEAGAGADEALHVEDPVAGAAHKMVVPFPPGLIKHGAGARGEREAVRLGERLKTLAFTAVLTSPLQRAVRTCELAGFGSAAKVDPDLVEWNYGAYEGRTSADIHAERPDWQLFRDGCPAGESPDQIGARADRVVHRVRAIGADVLLVSSGHFLRVLAARWLGLDAGAGRYVVLGTASLSAVGYEHDLSEPVLRLWNESPHF